MKIFLDINDIARFALHRLKKGSEAITAPQSQQDAQGLLKAEVVAGEALAELTRLPTASANAIITDPPYGLSQHSRRHLVATLGAWLDDLEVDHGKRRGFNGIGWDAGVPGPAVWKQAYRVLKPGGYLVAFGADRTHGLLSVALQLAGFQIVHVMPWDRGHGCLRTSDLGPFVQKVAKAADNDNTPDRVIARLSTSGPCRGRVDADPNYKRQPHRQREVVEVRHEKARSWAGSRTTLNVSHEVIIIARKRWKGKSVAHNILEHGAGGMATGPCGSGGKQATTMDAFYGLPLAVKFPRTNRADANRYVPEGTKNSHPCPKPIALMRWLVRLVCPAGGLILDPFAGSGTTGIAAVLEECEFVGIERDRSYADLANSRLQICQQEMRGAGTQTALDTPIAANSNIDLKRAASDNA